MRRLAGLGEFLRAAFADDLIPAAELSCDSAKPGHGIENAVKDDYEGYYMPDKESAEITVKLREKAPLGYLVIKENIRLSQRIESFAVDILEGETFREIYTGTTVGYKRIVPLNGAETDCLRIRITDSRLEPTAAFIGLYREAKTDIVSEGGR